LGDGKIGFDCCQVLLTGCNTLDELVEALRVVNDFAFNYMNQLMILDEIKNKNMMEK